MESLATTSLVRFFAMAQRIPQLELDNQLCFALYDASRAVIRAYTPLLADLGVTYPQYLTLLVLWEADRAVSVGELGERLHLDSGTLTPLLKRLEHLGLVDRRRDPADERRVLVALTAAGSRMRAKAAGIPGRLFPLYGIDIADAADLKNRLVALSEALQPSD
jgi:DNA-binding MarR family transcriptional regulator